MNKKSDSGDIAVSMDDGDVDFLLRRPASMFEIRAFRKLMKSDRDLSIARKLQKRKQPVAPASAPIKIKQDISKQSR